ncbi:CPBP family intramembrane metalloprotease [Lachnospiraceae bacterium MD1]|uniref:CPBP family intramembrane metalloprotease n=1 Tax=Variimorphobacter saccharofermentans TaxID=2755051 RepID=A0A839JVI5_9FIRM|nr:type II CAAX endopeptidase family protein [Variimorphobacter saccharofermentans]MBB2181653.1 CPBP family intramembrane metalloprotease [Variimorphobacter saccharofermentans]
MDQNNIEMIDTELYDQSSDQNYEYDMEQGIDPKKVITRVGLALFAMGFVSQLFQVVINTILTRFLPEVPETNWYIWLLTSVTIIGIGLPVFYLLVRKIPDSPKGEKVKLKISHFLGIFLVCAGAMYLSNLFGTIINFLISLLKGDDIANPALDAMSNNNFAITFLYVALIAPIVEEIIFRKLLLEKLRRFGDIPAMLLSGIAFGLYHMNLAQFVYASVLGIIFAYVVLKTNTIKYTIVLHMMINAMGTSFLPLVSDQNYIAIILMPIWVFTAIIVGILLFVLNRKQIVFHKSSYPIQKSVYILNAGTILFSLFCIIIIVAVTIWG